MSTIKSPLVALFLIMTSIVHCVFTVKSVESCRELLRKEPNFRDCPDGGQQNFISAFVHLSYQQIDLQFQKPTDREESKLQEKERLLRRKLTRSYFKYLFKDHGIDLSSRENLLVWCNSIASHDQAFHVVLESPIQDCKNLIERMFKTPHGLYLDATEPTYIQNVFEIMYKDWTYNSLRELGYVEFTGGTHIEKNAADWLKQKMSKDVEAYPVAYMQYFQDVLDVLEPGQGNFKSIEQYCREKGYKIVRKLKYKYNS